MLKVQSKHIDKIVKSLVKDKITKTQLNNYNNTINLINAKCLITMEYSGQATNPLTIEENFKFLFNSHYIADNIMTDIKKNMRNKYIIRYRFKTEILDINNIITIYSSSKNESKIWKLAESVIDRILFFNISLNTNKSPNLLIFMSNQKKVIPVMNNNNMNNNNMNNKNSNLEFNPKHINSAVTDGTNIIIFREEELLKSILHEAIHFFKVDFSPNEYPTSYINQYLTKYRITNIKNNTIRISESYTELLANLLNNIFISNNLTELENNNSKEINYSLFQVAKIFHSLGYKNTSDFLSNNIRNNTKDTKDLVQGSHVFSYYIVKSIFYYHINEFIDKIISRKGSCLMFNNKPKTYSHMDNLIIDNLSSDSNWSKHINKLLNKMNNKEIYQTIPIKMKNTMKMTINQ
jgi:hypothetical protein